ncbi:MAG: FAD-dependent oxidoreductase [Candidatus Omnitrophica bacterium]|nr:FAD-dependent oxidoreductase [Candidatus Omnitrophota bacterium]
MSKHLIILGAGISGLSAAWRASENSIKVDVFESGFSVGGLAGTMRQGQYSLDVGPHSFFSDDQEIVNLVCNLFENKLQPTPRKVKFYYRGKYMDYPLTAHGVLFQMGPLASIQAVGSFLKGKIFPKRRNFIAGEDETVEDWAITNFGGYLYRTFFKPYTEQFWKVPCSELSSRSIPTHTRMSFINTLKLLLHQKANKQGKSLIEREMRPTYYPDTGFVGIAEKIAKLIEKNHGQVHLGSEVTQVTQLPNGKMRIAYKCNGKKEEMEADQVISTIPLSLLAKMFAPAFAPKILASANKLEYRSLVVLGMLTQKQNILNCGYAYLLNRPFNRIFEMNEFSLKTSLPGENIIAVEIPCLSDSAIWKATKDELFNMCIASLAEDGFIGPGDIKKLFLVKAQYAYPIYRKDYAVHLAQVRDYLKKYSSLATLGRCGEFMYMDIDECMKRAFSLIDNLG